MAVKNEKGRYRSSHERGLGVHRSNDRLYRWAMWRMYLNHEMSIALFSPNTQRYRNSARTTENGSACAHGLISKMAAVYSNHKDSKQYGRLMKNLSKDKYKPMEMERILPDNVYLVYGIPRVSLSRTLPNGIRELHASVDNLNGSVDNHSGDSEETDRHINQLFDFVSDEITNFTVDSKDVTIERPPRQDNRSTKIKAVSNSNVDKDHHEGFIKDSVKQSDDSDKSGNSALPLVSKSRLFWEKLASKKSEIIANNPPKPPTSNVTKPASTVPETKSNAISSDALLRQHKLLKKTSPQTRQQARPQPRSSKDLWKTLRDRKTEILLLKDWNHKIDAEEAERVRKHQNKSNHFWGFIFSKKKELVQMKRGHKSSSFQNAKHSNDVKHRAMDKPTKQTNPVVIAPDNFQDNFQMELEARLKRMREKVETVPTTNL